MPVLEKSKVSLFADNTMFFSTNKNTDMVREQLQHQIDLTSDWFRTWRLKINSSKTTAVLFVIILIMVYDTPIKWSPQVKYLGVTIGRKLNFYLHVEKIEKMVTIVRGILYPVLNKRSLIPLNNRIQLLKLYISPILTYAGAAWAPLSVNHTGVD